MKIIYLQDEDRRRNLGVSSKGKIIEKETKRSKNESKHEVLQAIYFNS